MDNEIRLIDADALKEFINDGKVCDICDKRQPLCEYSCDFPDYVTPLWEKVIDSIPTVEPKLSDEQIEKIADLLETEWGYKGIREDVERIMRKVENEDN